MSETKVLTPNNVAEASSTTNGEVQTDKIVVIPDREWEEWRMDVPWGFIAGKWYGNRNQQPLLAFHGWQDNCGTFDRLIPLMPKTISVLAIDLPGHGRSSHFPAGVQYHIFWDYLPVLRRIVKHFGWKKVKLMGHSLGAALCFMYAATFPDEISQYITIDLIAPTVRCLKKNASVLGSCIDRALAYETLPVSKLPCYTYDEMVTIAEDAYDGSIDRKSAEILMIRGMNKAPAKHSKDGYFYSRDLRLKVAAMGIFSLEQVLTFAECIKCNVLNIRAIPGLKWDREEVIPIILDAIGKNANMEYHEVNGTHHLHLTTPERISQIINSFLLNPETGNDSDTE